MVFFSTERRGEKGCSTPDGYLSTPSRRMRKKVPQPETEKKITIRYSERRAFSLEAPREGAKKEGRPANLILCLCLSGKKEPFTSCQRGKKIARHQNLARHKPLADGETCPLCLLVELSSGKRGEKKRKRKKHKILLKLEICRFKLLLYAKKALSLSKGRGGGKGSMFCLARRRQRCKVLQPFFL